LLIKCIGEATEALRAAKNSMLMSGNVQALWRSYSELSSRVQHLENLMP
jgi:hypothetical protein